MNFFIISIISVSISLFLILMHILVEKSEKFNFSDSPIKNKGMFYIILVLFFITLIISMFIIMNFYSNPCKLTENCSTLTSTLFILVIPLLNIVIIATSISFIVRSIMNKNMEKLLTYSVLSVIISVSLIFLIKYYFQFLRPLFF